MPNGTKEQPPFDMESLFAQFQDMFGEFFGAAKSGKRGADLRQALELDHVEARDGVKREIQFERGVVEAGAVVRRLETLVVSVPAGVQHGQILRLIGKGDEMLD